MDQSNGHNEGEILNFFAHFFVIKIFANKQESPFLKNCFFSRFCWKHSRSTHWCITGREWKWVFATKNFWVKKIKFQCCFSAPKKIGKKRGRKPGQIVAAGSTRKKKRSVILKISRKKIKKRTPEESSEGPGPVDEGEYEVSWTLVEFARCLTIYLLQVEAIVDHKTEKGKTLYRIKWKGYPSTQDSWLNASDVTCKAMLKKYKKKIERDTKDVYVVSWFYLHISTRQKIFKMWSVQYSSSKF